MNVDRDDLAKLGTNQDLFFVVENNGDSGYLFDSESFRFNKNRVGDQVQPFVYKNAPGVVSSEHYKFQKYFKELSGWSNTYINFGMAEFGSPVEVEIEKKIGQVFRSAVVHPNKHASAVLMDGGKKVRVTIDEPCLITVDIDCHMDEQLTGMDDTKNNGKPIPTLTIFANPFFDAPALDDSVYFVHPSVQPPSEGKERRILYFLPGVHDIGLLVTGNLQSPSMKRAIVVVAVERFLLFQTMRTFIAFSVSATRFQTG